MFKRLASIFVATGLTLGGFAGAAHADRIRYDGNDSHIVDLPALTTATANLGVAVKFDRICRPVATGNRCVLTSPLGQAGYELGTDWSTLNG